MGYYDNQYIDDERFGNMASRIVELGDEINELTEKINFLKDEFGELQWERVSLKYSEDRLFKENLRLRNENDDLLEKVKALTNRVMELYGEDRPEKIANGSEPKPTSGRYEWDE